MPDTAPEAGDIVKIKTVQQLCRPSGGFLPSDPARLWAHARTPHARDVSFPQAHAALLAHQSEINVPTWKAQVSLAHPYPRGSPGAEAISGSPLDLPRGNAEGKRLLVQGHPTGCCRSLG